MFLYFCIMFMFCLRAHVCTMYVSVGSLGTGVVDGCAPPFECWDSNLRPLQEHQVLFTAEPHLQPSVYIF